MKNSKDIGPKISEPTQAEVSLTAEKIKRKYDIVITKDDAKKLAKLYKEIEWWFMVDKFSRSPKSISVDMAQEIREYFKKFKGQDLTLDEAHEYVKTALAKTISFEKERIAKEIKTIVDKY